MSKGCICDKCLKLIDTTISDYIHIDMPNFDDGYNTDPVEVHLDYHRECLPEALDMFISETF